MKKAFLCLLLVPVTFEVSIYSFSVDAANGATINLSQYQGKRILIVNTATNNEQASQFSELQQLYQQNIGNLVVIAFPSNDFGNESRSNQEMQSYLQTTYNVTFPVAAKLHVTDTIEQRHPFYYWLTKKTENGVMNSKIKNDFQKYLINKQGKIVGIFDSSVSPLSSEIQTALQIHN